MTTGPWKPISLQSYTERITDIDARAEVSEALEVKLSVSFGVSGHTPSSVATVSLRHKTSLVRAEQTGIKIVGERGHADFLFSKEDVELWYPVGYGKQPIYGIEIELRDQVHTVQSYPLILSTDILNRPLSWM